MPAETTTYTLTATDSQGDTRRANATVYVKNKLSTLLGAPASLKDLEAYRYCSELNNIATDGSENLYFTGDDAVCRLSTTGKVTVIASNGDSPTPLLRNSDGLHMDVQEVHQRATAASSRGQHSLLRIRRLLQTNQASAPVDNAQLNAPGGIAVSSDGKTIYVTDNYAIRRIVIADDGSATISTLAGILGTQGTSDGTATSASFYQPSELTLSGDDLYVVDGNAIRQVVISTGLVTTLAGKFVECSYLAESCSVDGDGSNALFHYPSAIVSDNVGNLYVSEPKSIRHIRLDTNADGTAKVTVSTLAGMAGTEGSTDGFGSAARFIDADGIAISSDGNTLYVSDDSTIRKIVLRKDSGNSGSVIGTVSTIAGVVGTEVPEDDADGPATEAWFKDPHSIVVGASGNLYVTEESSLRKIDLSTQTVSTVFTFWSLLAGDSINAGSMSIIGQMAEGRDGAIYVPDIGGNVIRKIVLSTNADGAVSAELSILAGTFGVVGHTDGVGAAASFNGPFGIAYDRANDCLYVSDAGNATIRKIDLATAAVTTLAGRVGTHPGPYPEDGIGSNATFSGLLSLAMDESGSLYVYEDWDMRKVNVATGEVQTLTFADSSGKTFELTSYGFGGMALHADSSTGKSTLYFMGDYSLYQADLSTLVVTKLAGSGKPGHADGTGSNAVFGEVGDLSIDKRGNLYAAGTAYDYYNSSDYYNGVVRRITPDGTVTTISLGTLPGGAMPFASGVFTDSSDNLLISVPGGILTLQP
jgi:DNA-binding beta-propeller fold protein YncE